MNVLDKISRLESQIEYLNSVINSGFDFEEWDLREYKISLAENETELAELNSLVEENKEVFYA